MVLSADPEIILKPSGEKRTEVTEPEWPWSGSNSASPFWATQIRTVLSADPEIILEPSGEKATEVTCSEWPWMGSKPGEIKFEEWMSNPRGTVLDESAKAPAEIATVMEKRVEQGDTKEDQPVVQRDWPGREEGFEGGSYNGRDGG